MTGPVDPPAGVEVITFGCRLNAYESEIVRAQAAAGGLTDAVIVNTCAVTAEAERQARQAIRKARRRRPTAQLIVTGCGAQIDPQGYAAMAEVDRVVGNVEKLRRETFGAPAAERVVVSDIMMVRETAGHLVENFDGRARAFLQIQNGCNHRCTFCVIPYGRGDSRSVPVGTVVDHAQQLVAGGFRELVLTGVDVGDYGLDLPGQPRLSDLVVRLLDKVPGMGRLRLSSIDPAEIDQPLQDLIAGERRVMPHVHLSVQSGDDLILRRMKRRHSRQTVIDLCRTLRMRRPGIMFGADLIAGFPTETDEAFGRTADLIEHCGIGYVHVFPYSARRGTPAALMPQVPVSDRRRRAAILREVGQKVQGEQFDRMVGSEAAVIIEEGDRGRTEHFAPIVLDQARPAGTVVVATIIGAAAGSLRGRVLGE
ncbi:MAG: tRNA (N(6)-L-threonylcarbamoyladenosine(37)-C(2))-methylthiotransferase MtaB [Alphaproteobacteria bacterium]|nr:tRNA (N(6)-L-threonylcarbamoyladenosine(37)-C(2))-methylthiotransferase MtaB [Alphaproteobacteria bacterium]